MCLRETAGGRGLSRRIRPLRPGNVRSADNLYMDGPEVFAFTMQVVPRLVRELRKLFRDDIRIEFLKRQK